MMLKNITSNIKAFTLSEIIIVIIIIGVTAGFAIPGLAKQRDIMRSQEGIQMLNVIKDAQILYRFETGGLAADLGLLSVNISELTYFNIPAVDGTNVVGKIECKSPTYTLCINDEGDLSCDGEFCENLKGVGICVIP